MSNARRFSAHFVFRNQFCLSWVVSPFKLDCCYVKAEPICFNYYFFTNGSVSLG